MKNKKITPMQTQQKFEHIMSAIEGIQNQIITNLKIPVDRNEADKENIPVRKSASRKHKKKAKTVLINTKSNELMTLINRIVNDISTPIIVKRTPKVARMVVILPRKLVPKDVALSSADKPKVKEDIRKSNRSKRNVARYSPGYIQYDRKYAETLQQALAESVLERASNVKHAGEKEGLESNKDTSVWVCCDNPTCNKWRYIPGHNDPSTLPEKWFCFMNVDDKNKNSCDAPEDEQYYVIEKQMIQNKYTEGSLVWVKVNGYPWWPAMIDECPNVNQYFILNSSNIPIKYNVVFFDGVRVTRSFINDNCLKKFDGTMPYDNDTKYCTADLKTRLKEAVWQASVASSLSINERWARYRYKTLLNATTQKFTSINPTSFTLVDKYEHLII